MPDFTKSTSFRVIRDLKAYLYLKAGLTRGRVPQERFPQFAQKKTPEGEVQQQHQGTTVENRQVFFIMGGGKSGTTWLQRLLNSHPEILCLGEGRFFNRDWGRDDLRHVEAKVPPRSLYGALSGSEDLRLWVQRSVWGRTEDPEKHIDNLTQLAIDYFLQQRLSKTRKRIVGDKTPILVGSNILEEIRQIYPEAKVIHIIRDGRDVEVSMLHHRWNKSMDRGGPHILKPEEEERRRVYEDGDRQKLATMGMFDEDELRRRARLWSSQVAGAMKDGPELLGENYTEVKYENLLQDTAKELKRLLGFLGANYDEGTVWRCVERCSFENLSGGRKQGQEDVNSFFRKGVAGDWQNVFTERDRHIYAEEAGAVLVRLGYERENGQ
jgi:Sulfotransferase domain